MNYILYTEFAILAVIVFLQIKSLYENISAINEYKKLFSNSNRIRFTSGSPIQVIADNDKIIHDEFKNILKNINQFLNKTKGSIEGSREIFGGLIDRSKYKYEDKIESQLSAPLYLGLGGTLIGICFGLFSLIKATSGSDIVDLSTEAISGLFEAVGYAIFVSLLGLLFVIYSTNFKYKKAKVIVDNLDAELRTKLELELLPNVSESTVSAIYDLKQHLTSFNSEFGKNLVQYSDNFTLLGDNLKSQEKVISLLNSGSFVQSIKEISNLLIDIRKVSDNFHKYKDYQVELINSFDKTIKVSDTYRLTLDKFQDFNNELSILSDSIESNTNFNKKFSKFLDNNFPESESAKEVYASQWRQIGDSLIKDIAQNSNNITKYFSDVNKEVEKFASSNKSLFDNFGGFKQAIEVMIKNSELSHVAFKQTQQNMDLIQKSIIDNNNTLKALTEAVKVK